MESDLVLCDWRPEMQAEGKMVVYAGWFRSIELVETVVDMGAGAGQIDCWACDGTGMFTGRPDGPAPCGKCKGTGKAYVSI